MENDVSSAAKSNVGAGRGWPDSLDRVVICIGAQKAATSFLFSVLDKDDRVCTAPVKEVHFWDTLDGVDARRFRRRVRRQLVQSIRGNDASRLPGLDQMNVSGNIKLALARHLGTFGVGFYRDFLQTNYQGEPVIFEASPGYALCSSKALAKMANVATDTRLIFLIRDPVERLWSASKYIWRRRLEKGEANQEDVYAFFEKRIQDRDSLGFRHSDYHRTFVEIQAADLDDKLTVVFQENLHLQSEQNVVAEALGFLPKFDMKKKVNTHSQHFQLRTDLLEDAINAFGPTYHTIGERFGGRVPDVWLR